MSVAISLESARLGPRGEWSRWERSQIERLRNGISCDEENLEWYEGVSDDEAPWIAAVYEDTDDLYLHITRVDDHYALLASDLSVEAVSERLSVLVDKSLKSPTPQVFKDNVRRVSFRLDPVAMAAAVALAVGQWYRAQKQAVSDDTTLNAVLDQRPEGVAITFPEPILASSKAAVRRSTSFTTEKRQIDSLFTQDSAVGAGARGQAPVMQSSANAIRTIEAFGVVIATALGTAAAVAEPQIASTESPDDVLASAFVDEGDRVEEIEISGTEPQSVVQSSDNEEIPSFEPSEQPLANESEVARVQHDMPEVDITVEPVAVLRSEQSDEASQRHPNMPQELEVMSPDPAPDQSHDLKHPPMPRHVNPQDIADLRELAACDRFDFDGNALGARPPMPEWMQAELDAWEAGDYPEPPMPENMGEEALLPPEVAEAILPFMQCSECPVPQDLPPFPEDTFLF